MAADKVYLIDIRSAADYAKGHMEGAVNVAAADVLAHLDGTDVSSYDEGAIVCYTGQTASWVTSLLQLAGYNNVYSMKWGMSGWHLTLTMDQLKPIARCHPVSTDGI